MDKKTLIKRIREQHEYVLRVKEEHTRRVEFLDSWRLRGKDEKLERLTEILDSAEGAFQGLLNQLESLDR